MGQVIGASVVNRVWRTLTTLVRDQGGPLALQHVPYLATGDVGADGEPRSSILFPAGLRQALLASFGPAAAGLRLDRPDPPPGEHPELSRLANDVKRFATLSAQRQAQLVCCLNTLTEQRIALPLVARLPVDYFRHSHGARVLYEGARALIRLGKYEAKALTVLEDLTRQDANPEIAVSAAIQRGSAAIRIERDLTGAQRFIALADNLRTGLGSDPFVDTLMASRYHRLVGLLEARKADNQAATEALDRAEAAAEACLHEVRDNGGKRESTYRYLVAAESYKILAESRIKATGMSRDITSLVTWARRILAVDPADPFTWRCIAENAHRCGLSNEAALALAGQAATGGPGVAMTLAVLGEPGGAHFESTQLRAELLDRLGKVYDGGED